MPVVSKPRWGIPSPSRLATALVLGAVAGATFLSGPVSAGTVFGSKLNHEPTPTESCRQNKPANICSWVLEIGQQNVGKEAAPKNGTIIKLRLRSCSPGSFALQIARAFPATDRARVVKTGPTINYRGNPNNCSGGTFIETFNVNVPVLKGDYLAVLATRVGFIYNASGEGSLVFDPPLPDGGPLRLAVGSGVGDGFLLLQAELNN